MPKLDAKQAAEVEASEAMSGGGFLLEPGRYAARLRKVDEMPGKEFPYWDWEFEALHDEAGDQKTGRQWNRTSLSPKAAGFLKACFAAFGYSPDSDTDELVGEWVVLYLEQEKQTVGKGVGKMRNVITRLAEFDPDEWDFDPSAVTVKEREATAEGGGAGDDF